jgi:hypothetical protein
MGVKEMLAAFHEQTKKSMDAEQDEMAKKPKKFGPKGNQDDVLPDDQDKHLNK